MRAIQEQTTCVFSFWNGMPYDTQVHVLRLCVTCPTVRTFAVFRDLVRMKWEKPGDGPSISFVFMDQQPLTTSIPSSFDEDPGDWV